MSDDFSFLNSEVPKAAPSKAPAPTTPTPFVWTKKRRWVAGILGFIAVSWVLQATGLMHSSSSHSSSSTYSTTATTRATTTSYDSDIRVYAASRGIPSEQGLTLVKNTCDAFHRGVSFETVVRILDGQSDLIRSKAIDLLGFGLNLKCPDVASKISQRG
jgi:hypothetical protein